MIACCSRLFARLLAYFVIFNTLYSFHRAAHLSFRHTHHITSSTSQFHPSCYLSLSLSLPLCHSFVVRFEFYLFLFGEHLKHFLVSGFINSCLADFCFWMPRIVWQWATTTKKRRRNWTQIMMTMTKAKKNNYKWQQQMNNKLANEKINSLCNLQCNTCLRIFTKANVCVCVFATSSVRFRFCGVRMRWHQNELSHFAHTLGYPNYPKRVSRWFSCTISKNIKRTTCWTHCIHHSA